MNSASFQTHKHVFRLTDATGLMVTLSVEELEYEHKTSGSISSEP